MVDSEYSAEIYKSWNITIETVMRNLKMLKFVPGHLETKENVEACSKNIALSINVCSWSI